MLVYIFNKETLIPYVLNNAIQKQQGEKVQTLGPYAVVLSFILYGAPARRGGEKLDLKKLYIVQKINERLFKDYLRNLRKEIALRGYFKMF